MDENEADAFKATGTTRKDKSFVSALKGLTKVPDFTDAQEEFLQRIISAFNEGDLPARDVQKINRAVREEPNPLALFQKIRDLVDEKYLFGRQQAENLSAHQRQVILSCSLKGG